MAESTAPPGRIFISYRREETAYPAAWLFDRLADQFGETQIFKDVDSIELGDDFVEVITDAVASCDVLLALIGDRWLTITDDEGRRRLDNPDDFVRLEIEAALVRKVRVVPILVAGATMPRPDQLPPSLAALVRRHALELSPVRFDSDTERLVRVLQKTLAEVQSGPPPRHSDHAVPPHHHEEDLKTRDREESRDQSGQRGSEDTAPRPVWGRLLGQAHPGPLAAAIVVILVVAVVLIAAVVSRDGDAAGPRDVVVDGTRLWTDSRVALRAGDEVQVTARGTIFHNETSSIGPEGFPNRPDLLTPLDRANHAGLLGRVGDTGEPFFVGRGTSFIVDRDGRLFLGINDGGLENNRGFFTATVRVRRDQ